MSAFLTFPWPTTAHNKTDPTAQAATALQERILHLANEAYQRCADASRATDIAALGATKRDFILPHALPTDSDDEVGRRWVNACLQTVVNTVTWLYSDPADTLNLMLSFDGRRWWATMADPAYIDGIDRLLVFRLLEASRITVAPTDGREFIDLPAVTAAVCVLDELAADTRRALAAVGLTDAQREAVDQALEDAR